MTQPAKKPNGSKTKVNLVCPHGDVCAAPSMHGEMMKNLDDISLSMQMLIQRVEQIHTETLERAKLYIDCNEKVLDRLVRIEEKVEEANA